MAGLSGVIALAADVDAVGLNGMLSARLAHRGPDGAQSWSGPGAAMSHLALHTSSIGATVVQPLRLNDGRILVVDGFVGDRDSLLVALDWQGDAPEPTDSQLIAMAIEAWGVEFWRRVDGDFAVALWDPGARTLLLVRDRLGVRPLFHVRTDQLVAFSSEPEPLYGLPGVNRRVRDASVAEIWTQLRFPKQDWSDAPGTVSFLPAAHRVCVARSGSMVLERYWRLEPRASLQLKDEREFVEAFQEVFGRAFNRANRGIDTCALMLSGGIDSGAILAAARGFRQGATSGRLLCISAVTSDSIDDEGYRAETRNIRALTKGEPKVAQFTVPIQPNTGEVIEAADAAEVAWSYLHPVDASIYIPSLVCRVARKQGCRVVMGGIDGDVVASAPFHYVGTLARTGKWRMALAEAAMASRVHTYRRDQSQVRILLSSILAESQPVAVRRFRARRTLDSELSQLRSSELSPSFIKGGSIEEQYSTVLAERLERLELAPEQQRCLSMTETLGSSLMAFNQVTSRQGLEARYPWADMSVIEFFLSLPLEWRARHGWTKYLVRRACEASLGPEVAWHYGKRHHGPLVTKQLVADAAPVLRSYLRSKRPMLSRYLNCSFLDQVDALLALPDELAFDQPDMINGLVALAGWLDWR